MYSKDQFYNFINERLHVLHRRLDPKFELPIPEPEWNTGTPKRRTENIFRQTDRTSLYIRQKLFKASVHEVLKFQMLNSMTSYEKFQKSSLPLEVYVQQEHSQGIWPYGTAYEAEEYGNQEIVESGLLPTFLKICDQAIENEVKSEDFMAILECNMPKSVEVPKFLCYQIILNLTLAGLYPEEHDFCALGKGSSSGLEKLDLPHDTDESTMESLHILLKGLPNYACNSNVPNAVHLQAMECKWTLETMENALCNFHQCMKYIDGGKILQKGKRPYVPYTGDFDPEPYYSYST